MQIFRSKYKVHPRHILPFPNTDVLQLWRYQILMRKVCLCTAYVDLSKQSLSTRRYDNKHVSCLVRSYNASMDR